MSFLLLQCPCQDSLVGRAEERGRAFSGCLLPSRTPGVWLLSGLGTPCPVSGRLVPSTSAGCLGPLMGWILDISDISFIFYLYYIFSHYHLVPVSDGFEYVTQGEKLIRLSCRGLAPCRAPLEGAQPSFPLGPVVSESTVISAVWTTCMNRRASQWAKPRRLLLIFS